MCIKKITYQLPLVFDALGADEITLIAPPLGFAALTHASCTTQGNKILIPDFYTKEFVGLQFNIGTDLHYTVNGTPGNLRSNHFNFIYVPAGMNCSCTIERGTYISFSIHFPRQYLVLLENYFPSLLRNLLSHVEAKTPVALSKAHLPMDDKLMTMISNIYDLSWRGICRDAFLNCKVFQILLHCFQTINKRAERINFLPNDLEKIKNASTYLNAHLSDHFSSNLVASVVDMDLYKLRKGFKELYNSTMMDFIYDKRMEKALLLLKGSNLPIEKIGHKLGYKRVGHFSIAFKRKYGFPPSTVRAESKRTNVNEN